VVCSASSWARRRPIQYTSSNGTEAHELFSLLTTKRNHVLYKLWSFCKVGSFQLFQLILSKDIWNHFATCLHVQKSLIGNRNPTFPLSENYIDKNMQNCTSRRIRWSMVEHWKKKRASLVSETMHLTLPSHDRMYSKSCQIKSPLLLLFLFDNLEQYLNWTSS
jgi:hypothetical protein